MVSSFDDDPLLKELPEVEGYKVLGPCVLFNRLGSGAMGTVYHGRHLNLDIDVAVKCLNRSLVQAGASFVARFQREARLAAGVHHQNLIQVYDVSHAGDLHYLVMEFVRGETARERVMRKGPLCEAEACRVLLGAASGLAQAHARRIVHRDIKPDNILISRDGEVKVSDLGLAKALESDEILTMSHAVMGTPQFMPPEQWTDAATVGPPADVWALGITLYFLLTGSHAFATGSMNEICKRICVDPLPDVRTILPGISADVLRVLERCVARDLDRRYADAQAVIADLQRCLASDTTVLIDPNAGNSRGQDTLITPPPADTLMRIRTSVDSSGLPPPLDMGRARTAARAPTPPPAQAPREIPVVALEPKPASRSWAIAAAAAVGVVVLVTGGALVVNAMRKDGQANSSNIALEPSAEPRLLPAQPAQPSVTTQQPATQPSAKPAPIVEAASDEPRPIVEPTIQSPQPSHTESPTPPPVVAPLATPAHVDQPVAPVVPVAPPAREETAPVPVQIELDAALAAKPIHYTKASEFVVRGRVKQGKVESLAVTVDGKPGPVITLRDQRFEARIPLDADRPFELVITCAGLATPIAFSVVRDTHKPGFVSSTPAQDSVVSKLAPFDLEFTFDEAVEKVMFEGVLMTVEGATARRSVTPSQISGPWRPQWTAWDHAKNESTGVLVLKVR